ncbi:MAG: ribonuclease HIII [Opitutales bacterium]|nr:ribonuclease HIII [Opitutales bacterium]
MARKANSQDSGPKKKSIYTIKLTDEQMDKLDALLQARGWFEHDVDHSRFGYKWENVNIVAYKSGKLVVQGKKTEDFVQDILEAEITYKPLMGYEEFHNPEWFEPHAGLDESGKGDFFGPLITCTVIADEFAVRTWMDAGIKDSKRISSDRAIKILARTIRETKGIVIKHAWAGMPKYNEMYNKFGRNVNKLLAWFHARALTDALEQKHVPWGLLDQFSKQPLVQRQLKVKKFDLQMRPKAEEDPVVAAASIMARAEYVRQMEKLSEKAGMLLPKGASATVKTVAREIISKHGPEALPLYAKMHFKTANEVLSS